MSALLSRRSAFQSLLNIYENDLSSDGAESAKHNVEFVKKALLNNCIEAVTKTDPRLTSTTSGAVAVSLAKTFMTNEKASRGFIDIEIEENKKGPPTFIVTFDKTVNEDQVTALAAEQGTVSKLCKPGDQLPENIVSDVYLLAVEPTPQLVEGIFNSVKDRLQKAWKTLTTKKLYHVETKLSTHASVHDTVKAHLDGVAKSMGGGTYHTVHPSHFDSGTEMANRRDANSTHHAFDNEIDAKKFSDHVKSMGHKTVMGSSKRAEKAVYDHTTGGKVASKGGGAFMEGAGTNGSWMSNHGLAREFIGRFHRMSQEHKDSFSKEIGTHLDAVHHAPHFSTALMTKDTDALAGEIHRNRGGANRLFDEIWKRDSAKLGEGYSDPASKIAKDDSKKVSESKTHAAVSKSLYDAGMDGRKLFASPAEGWSALHGALAQHGIVIANGHTDHGTDHYGTYPLSKIVPGKDPEEIEGSFLHVARSAGVGDSTGGVDSSDHPIKGKHEFNVYLTGKKMKDSAASNAGSSGSYGESTFAYLYGDKALKVLLERDQMSIAQSLVKAFQQGKTRVKEQGTFDKVMAAAVAVSKGKSGTLTESVADFDALVDDVAVAIHESVGDRLVDLAAITVMNNPAVIVSPESLASLNKHVNESAEARAALLQKVAKFVLACEGIVPDNVLPLV